MAPGGLDRGGRLAARALLRLGRRFDAQPELKVMPRRRRVRWGAAPLPPLAAAHRRRPLSAACQPNLLTLLPSFPTTRR